MEITKIIREIMENPRAEIWLLSRTVNFLISEGRVVAFLDDGMLYIAVGFYNFRLSVNKEQLQYIEGKKSFIKLERLSNHVKDLYVGTQSKSKKVL